MLESKMFRLIIIFVIAFSAIDCYAIDLEEALSKAIKNSSKIKSQFYQYKSAEKYYKSSGLAGLLPDINLQYNFDSSFSPENSEKDLNIKSKNNRWWWHLCYIQSIK